MARSRLERDYIVRRRPDNKSVWAFQIYESQIELRVARFSEFDLVVICDYDTPSERRFRIPYSYLRTNIFPRADMDDRGRWLFEVDKSTNRFNWRHGIHMNGNQLSVPQHQIIRKPLSRTAMIKKYGHREESLDHKVLKEWIVNNPDFIGLSDVNKAIIEYEFPSGDRVDVVFERTDNRYTVVEVETDIPLPGVYQALKYRTLRCAELGLPIDSSDVEAVLVAWSLSPEVKAFCKKYNIKCVEKKL